jgi:copper(I)-binding protein
MGSAVADPRATIMPIMPPLPFRRSRLLSLLRPARPLCPLLMSRPLRLKASHRLPGRPGAAGPMLGLGLALASLALAGCAQRAAASGPRMELATATVGMPQGSSPTDAYLDIRNNGAADRLVSVRSSAGGAVTLSGPANGGPTAMRTVTFITVPARTLIRLVPNGYHLVITDSGPMKSGTEITLTLRFAHAGTYRIAAEVTNPQTGGSSYFLN